MEKNPSPLENLTVASPCPVSWDSMTGTARVRDCSQCRMKVYDLSQMTRPDAEKLLTETEGRLCVRFFRRPDGTIMTADCPVGLRAVRLKIARLAAGAVTMAVALFYAVVLRRQSPQTIVQPHLMGEAAVQGDVMMGAPPPLSTGGATTGAVKKRHGIMMGKPVRRRAQ